MVVACRWEVLRIWWRVLHREARRRLRSDGKFERLAEWMKRTCRMDSMEMLNINMHRATPHSAAVLHNSTPFCWVMQLVHSIYLRVLQSIRVLCMAPYLQWNDLYHWAGMRDPQKRLRQL